jgi:AraC-like DNA-binding protein
MDLIPEERQSDSPFIERIWRSRNDQPGHFISMAETHWSMVVSRVQGSMTLTVRGPETRASSAFCPPESEFFGIMFKPGTLLNHLPPKMLMDRRDVNLPQASSRTFWLNGAAWQFPDFDNADTFVDWLARDGLLLHDPVVGSVLRARSMHMSLRTVQRRFLGATGMTQKLVYQIERARHALTLLKGGLSILDTTYQAGYSDQAHLTRSLRHFTGHTPAQVISHGQRERLSYLFKSDPY